MKIDQAIASLNKKYGENTLGYASDLKYSDVPRLSSGSLMLDWALGKNRKDNASGWPLGRIVELFGQESSGKSLISMKTITEAQGTGFDCIYFDCENSWDKTFAEKLGVDSGKLLISRESQGEKLLDLACELLSNSKLKVMVFDSLASMIPTVEIEKSLEEQQMAPMARLMSKGLRKLTACNKNNALIIFINQLRKNPGAGPYANPEYTPGGQSLKFYSSLRVEVRKGDWIEEEEKEEGKKRKIGQFVKFRVVKNKTDIPLREGNFKFLYTGEIDKVDELISLGLLNNLIERKGPYYYFVSRTFQGREEMEKALKEDKELFEVAKKEVLGK